MALKLLLMFATQLLFMNVRSPDTHVVPEFVSVGRVAMAADTPATGSGVPPPNDHPALSYDATVTGDWALLMYRNSMRAAAPDPSLAKNTTWTQSLSPAAASAGPDRISSASAATAPAAMFATLLSRGAGAGNWIRAAGDVGSSATWGPCVVPTWMPCGNAFPNASVPDWGATDTASWRDTAGGPGTGLAPVPATHTEHRSCVVLPTSRVQVSPDVSLTAIVEAVPG